MFPHFTAEELKLVPYSGNEILKFEDSLGNSFTLYGLGRIDTLINEMKAGCDACSPGSFYRRNSTFFTDPAINFWGPSTCGFNLESYGDKDEPIEKSFYIFLNFRGFTGDSLHTGVFTTKIINSQFVLGTYDLGPYSHSYSPVNLLNNYSFNSTLYPSVYQIFDYNWWVYQDYPPQSPAVKYIIYSLDKGVLKIELTDGSVWNLVE